MINLQSIIRSSRYERWSIATVRKFSKKVLNTTSAILSKYIRGLKYPGTSEQEMFCIAPPTTTTTTTEEMEAARPCPAAGSR